MSWNGGFGRRFMELGAGVSGLRSRLRLGWLGKRGNPSVCVFVYLFVYPEIAV